MNAARGEVLMLVVGFGTGGYGLPNGTAGEYCGPEQVHHTIIARLKMGVDALIPPTIASHMTELLRDRLLAAYLVPRYLKTDYIDLFLIH